MLPTHTTLAFEQCMHKEFNGLSSRDCFVVLVVLFATLKNESGNMFFRHQRKTFAQPPKNITSVFMLLTGCKQYSKTTFILLGFKQRMSEASLHFIRGGGRRKEGRVTNKGDVSITSTLQIYKPLLASQLQSYRSRAP